MSTTGTDAFNDENRFACFDGGMHFIFATDAGAELGTQVAQWVTTRNFGRQQ